LIKNSISKVLNEYYNARKISNNLVKMTFPLKAKPEVQFGLDVEITGTETFSIFKENKKANKMITEISLNIIFIINH
jgi:hypothetical protein